MGKRWVWPHGPKSEGVLGGGGRLIKVGAVIVEFRADSVYREGRLA